MRLTEGDGDHAKRVVNMNAIADREQELGVIARSLLSLAKKFASAITKKSLQLQAHKYVVYKKCSLEKTAELRAQRNLFHQA